MLDLKKLEQKLLDSLKSENIDSIKRWLEEKRESKNLLDNQEDNLNTVSKKKFKIEIRKGKMKILFLTIVCFLYLMNLIFGFGFFLPTIATYNSSWLSFFMVMIFDLTLISNYFLINFAHKI